jgi:hypothetical protein
MNGLSTIYTTSQKNWIKIIYLETKRATRILSEKEQNI